MNDMEHYTLDRFQPLLGESFEISGGGSTVQATLVEVADLREAQGAGLRSRQFSLVWRGPCEPVLPQQIHRVTHAAIGSLDLFLVPIGPDAGGMRYEAVFT